VKIDKLALIAGFRKVLQKEKEKKSDLDGKCLLLLLLFFCDTSVLFNFSSIFYLLVLWF
jgi:hypothetical protein